MSRSRRFRLTEDETLQTLMCDDSGGESGNELDGEDEAFIEQNTNSNIDEIIIDDPGALINDDIEEQPPKRTKLQLDNFTWQKSHNPTVLPEQPVPYGEKKLPSLLPMKLILYSSLK